MTTTKYYVWSHCTGSQIYVSENGGGFTSILPLSVNYMGAYEITELNLNIGSVYVIQCESIGPGIKTYNNSSTFTATLHTGDSGTSVPSGNRIYFDPYPVDSGYRLIYAGVSPTGVTILCNGNTPDITRSTAGGTSCQWVISSAINLTLSVSKTGYILNTGTSSGLAFSSGTNELVLAYNMIAGVSPQVQYFKVYPPTATITTPVGITTNEVGSFIDDVGKIYKLWTVEIPSGTTQTLSITKTGYTTDTFDFSYNSTNPYPDSTNARICEIIGKSRLNIKCMNLQVGESITFALYEDNTLYAGHPLVYDISGPLTKTYWLSASSTHRFVVTVPSNYEDYPESTLSGINETTPTDKNITLAAKQTTIKTVDLYVYPQNAAVTYTGTIQNIGTKTFDSLEPAKVYRQYSLTVPQSATPTNPLVVSFNKTGYSYVDLNVDYTTCPTEWKATMSSNANLIVYSSTNATLKIDKFTVSEPAGGDDVTIIEGALPLTKISKAAALTSPLTAYPIYGTGITYTIKAYQTINGVLTLVNTIVHDGTSGENPIDLDLTNVSIEHIFYVYPYGCTIEITDSITTPDTTKVISNYSTGLTRTPMWNSIVSNLGSKLFEKVSFTGLPGSYPVKVKRQLPDAADWTFYSGTIVLNGGDSMICVFLSPTPDSKGKSRKLIELLLDGSADTVYWDDGINNLKTMNLEIPNPGLDFTTVNIGVENYYLYGLVVPIGSKGQGIIISEGNPNVKTNIYNIL